MKKLSDYIVYQEVKKREIKHKGLSLEEYRSIQPEHVSDVLEILGNEEENELREEIYYFWDCIEELPKEKIKNLWEKLLEYFNEEVHYEFLYIMTLLSKEAELEKKEILRIDEEISNIIKYKIKKEINEGKGILEIINYILEYFQEKAVFFDVLEIKDINYKDGSIFQDIFKYRREDLNVLSNNKNSYYYGLINIIYFYYKVYLTEKIPTYLLEKILREKVLLSRDLGLLEEMSDSIYAYSKFRMKRKKVKSFILDFLIGYGEKPFRLIRAYIVFQIIFISIYISPFLYSSLSSLKLEGGGITYTETSLIKLIVDIFYFNNTTVFTIGYGDIYPSSLLSKIIVAFQQALGFSLTGGFVSLWLRKMFRF